MAKRNDRQPDKFQLAAVESRPAIDMAVSAAVHRFVTMFVIRAKRERMATMLLHKQREKRTEAIQTVYKWIEPSRQTELGGNMGFPQHLKKRFGDLSGILVDESGGRHLTIAEAAVVATGRFGAIFIADTPPIALLCPEVGPPTLCSLE